MYKTTHTIHTFTQQSNKASTDFFTPLVKDIREGLLVYMEDQLCVSDQLTGSDEFKDQC